MSKKVLILDCVDVINRRISEYKGEKLYISTGAVDINKVDYKQAQVVTFSNRPSRANVVAQENEILFAKMKDTQKTLLVTGIEQELIFSTGFYCLRAKRNKVLPKFLFSYINSPFFLEQKDKYCTGATQQALNNDGLSKIIIPVLKLEEQKKIAEILDKASTLISLRKKQIEKLDFLVKAKFVEMFGDPIANENNFKIHSLMDCYDKEDAIKCGPFGSALKKDEYIESGIPVWNMDNITKQGRFIKTANLWIALEKYHELKSYSVHNGDIIISRAGTVGKMCVVSSEYENSIISTNLIRLRLNERILPLYFVMLVNVHGNKVCQLRTGGDNAFTHMNTGVLNSIKIPLPPLDLQTQFASFVQQVEQQKAQLQQALEKLELNYKALMQQYFG